ncbi:MAG: hypothetical protein D6729_10785 [Deltaproteobacteria bacterium]|nr:MAG: hypothetical protein D6729_10785 [Deltaproteobacteria bacterium]
MQAKRLEELREILSSDSFRAWLDELRQANEALKEAEARYESLLTDATLADFRAELSQKNAIETVYAAGDYEDEAARLLAEATEIENRSIAAVAAFEEQRFRASDAWIRLGAIEKTLEELKEAKASGSTDRARLDEEIQRVTRERRAAHDVYERESARKAQLWAEVEAMWQQSAQLSLTCAEKEMKATKVRRQAEKLFAASEEQKKAAEGLRAEAEALAGERARLEAQQEALRKNAQNAFGCLAGEDFLYWGAKENNKVAYAVALVADRETYNIELEEGGLYQVTIRRGVRFLEPVLKGANGSTDEDKRLEAYFLGTHAPETEKPADGGENTTPRERDPES